MPGRIVQGNNVEGCNIGNYQLKLKVYATIMFVFGAQRGEFYLNIYWGEL